MSQNIKIQYYSSYFSIYFPLTFEDLKLLCHKNNIEYNDEKHIFIYNKKKIIEDEISYKEIYNNPNKNENIFRVIEKDKIKYKFEQSELIELTFDGKKKINPEEIIKLEQKKNNLEELEKLLKSNIKFFINKIETRKIYLLQLEKIINEKEKKNNAKIDNNENENIIIVDKVVDNKKKENNGLNKEDSIEKKMIKNRVNQIKKEYKKLQEKYNELKSINKLKEIEEQKKLMKENKEIIKVNEELSNEKNRIMNNIIKTFADNSSNYKKKLEHIQNEYNKKINNIFLNLEDKMKKISIEKLEQKINEYIIQFKNDNKIREENLNKYEEEYKNIREEFNNIISSNNFNHEIKCNNCNKNIIGIRYECSECQFNLCEICELKNYLYITHPHKFYKIRKIKKKKSMEFLNSKEIFDKNIYENNEKNT